MTDYTGVCSTSCTYPQSPESSPGDDVAAYGGNARAVPLGALAPIPPPNGHTRIGTLSGHIVAQGRFRALAESGARGAGRAG